MSDHQPGCERAHEVSDSPCGKHHVPGSPCEFCGKPTPLDSGFCPDCWTPVPDNLADIKALLALGDLSVDPARLTTGEASMAENDREIRQALRIQRCQELHMDWINRTRQAIHEVGPAGDRARAALGLRWGPVHEFDGEQVRRPIGDRVPAEPLALCAHCGRGMNPGDQMCCARPTTEGGQP